jgi:hypothetical protein
VNVWRAREREGGEGGEGGDRGGGGIDEGRDGGKEGVCVSERERD